MNTQTKNSTRPEPTPFARFLFENGLTQTDIADGIRRSVAYMSMIAAGQRRAPDHIKAAVARVATKKLKRAVTEAEIFSAPEPASTGRR